VYDIHLLICHCIFVCMVCIRIFYTIIYHQYNTVIIKIIVILFLHISFSYIKQFYRETCWNWYEWCVNTYYGTICTYLSYYQLCRYPYNDYYLSRCIFYVGTVYSFDNAISVPYNSVHVLVKWSKCDTQRRVDSTRAYFTFQIKM